MRRNCFADQAIKTPVSPLEFPVDLDEISASPLLMVSDSPETVTGANGVLWQHTVPNGGNMRHRVFIWHRNNTATADTIALTLENLSPTVPLTVNFRAAYGTDTDGTYYAVGAGNARCLVTDFANIQSGVATIPHNKIGALAILSVWSRPSGSNGAILTLLGAQIDLNLQEAVPYRLRTVFGQSNDDFTQAPYNGRPLPLGPGARGGWPFSETTTVVSYQVGFLNLPAFYVLNKPAWYNEWRTEPADWLSCTNAIVPLPYYCTRKNDGPYGAIINITANLSNITPCPAVLSLGVDGHGSHHTWGAADRGVTLNGSRFPMTRLMASDVEYTELRRVTVPGFTPPAQPVVVRMRWAIAGGSYSPAALIIQRVS